MNKTISFIVKFLAVLLVFSLAACGSSEERRDSFYEKSTAYFEEGKLDEARVEIRNALKIDQNFAPGYQLLGKIFERQKNWKNSFANYSKAVELDPGLIESQLGLARIYAMGNESEKSLEKAEIVLAADPDYTDAKIIKGLVLLRQGDETGIGVLNEVIGADPSKEEPYVLLGDYYLQQENVDKSLEVFKQGVSANPDSKVLLFKLAGVYTSLKDFAKAEELYTRIYETDPKSAANRNLMIGFYVTEGDYGKALEMLDTFIAEEPSEQSYRINKARILLSQNDRQGAEQTLRKGIAEIEKAYDLRFFLAEMLHADGQTEAAMELMHETAELDPEAPKTLDARKGLAKAYLEQGEVDKAEEELLKVSDKASGDPEYNFLMGSVDMAKARFKDAINQLRQTVDGQPDNVRAYVMLAEAHFRSNEPLLGAEALRNGIEANPDDIRIRHSLVQYLVRNRDLDEALSQLKRIQEVDPKDERAIVLEGDVRMMQRDLAKAEEAYRLLQEVNPESPMALFKLGQLYAVKQEFDRAHVFFDRALEKTPEAFEVIREKAGVYMAAKEPEKALDFVANQLEKQPENPLLYELQGRMHASLGDFEKAEASFFKATELQPEWLLPYYRIGALYLQRGEVDKGIEKFEAALEKNPDSMRLAFTLGTLYQSVNNYQKAREKYEYIIEKSPDFVPALNNLAYLISENTDDPDELQKALEMAQRAALTEEPSALDTAGWIHYKLGNIEQALDYLDRAHRAQPEIPDIGYHLALALKAKGDNLSAQKVLEPLLDHERASEEMKQNIRSLYEEVS